MAEFNPEIPFNKLPMLPPPADQVETTDILKQCINARVAMAELKQAAELIPNAAVLVNALPLLEARASSEIRTSSGKQQSKSPSIFAAKTLRINAHKSSA